MKKILAIITGILSIFMITTPAFAHLPDLLPKPCPTIEITIPIISTDSYIQWCLTSPGPGLAEIGLFICFIFLTWAININILAAGDKAMSKTGKTIISAILALFFVVSASLIISTLINLFVPDIGSL